MLQNAYFLAKIGADTAENERNFAENLAKIGNYPTGPLPSGACARAAGRRRGAAGLLGIAQAAGATLLADGTRMAKLDLTPS